MAQAIYAAKEEGKQLAVVADDTDVYIMLLYHYHAEYLTIPMKLVIKPRQEELALM